MKFDFLKIWKILAAIRDVENTVKGGGSKKAKVIEVAKTALGVTKDLSPAGAAKIDRLVDDLVDVANGNVQ